MVNCKKASDVLVSALISSFAANLCLYSENSHIGYTLLSQEKTIQVYGTSTLSLQGITPKWLICYDLFTNQYEQTYCKVAHGVDYEFMKNHINRYIFTEFKLKEAEKTNPFYMCIKK